MAEKKLNEILNISFKKEIDEDFIKQQEQQYQQELTELKNQSLIMIKQQEYQKSGVNKKFWKENIETFIPVSDEELRNLNLVKNFIVGKGRKMLLLIGNYGTGKTHLGASIIRECGGRFISSFELCTRYEMGSDYKAEKNKLQVLEEFSDYPMLVIDEIGRGTQSEKILLSYLINQFYEKENRLVLITNLKKDDFIKLIGEATVDRLKEVCSTLTFTGQSKRK